MNQRLTEIDLPEGIGPIMRTLGQSTPIFANSPTRTIDTL